MHVPASFSLASARLCLLLPRHLGLGQVPVLLVGASQPSGVFLLLAARLCDSRQVSHPLWAHTVVNEVMSGLVPQEGRSPFDRPSQWLLPAPSGRFP